MLRIDNFINELLFHHECVIIPNFGGFMANYHHAEIIENQNSFLPPAKDISFNQKLTHNDGLLINHIAECKNISYNEAKQKVENYVIRIKNDLSQLKTIPFEEIGLLFYNKNNKLQFEPKSSTNYLLDSFGLSSFQVQPIDGYDYKKETSFNIHHLLKSNLAKASIIILPILITFSIISSQSNFMNNISAGISFIFNQAEEQTSYIEQAKSSNTVSINNAIEEATEKQHALFYEEVNYKEKVIVDNIEVPVINNRYYIIAGSYNSLLNAKNHCKNLLDKGFDIEILEENEQRYRIAINSFKRKENAINELHKVRKNKKHSTFWILAK